MEELINVLSAKGMTLSCAESLTGGLFAATLCQTAGVSKVFKGGVVTYCNESKHDIIQVPQYIIDEYGVVSAECASCMARGVKKIFNSDIAISFTGNAGPGTLEGKPVGLVYIGLCIQETTMSFECLFDGERNQIRQQCVEEGIKKILELI